LSLDQLIKQCKKSELKAQEQLYRLFSGKLFSVCLKYSRNKTEAEDNLQDSFITIFDKIGQYKFKGSFEGWMRRITVNTVMQKYRAQDVYDIVNENAIEAVEVEVDEEGLSMDVLLNIVQELPDRYRMVFNLYVLDGYSHKEIGKMMGISDGTSKSNLARARNILKEKIELLQEKKISIKSV